MGNTLDPIDFGAVDTVAQRIHRGKPLPVATGTLPRTPAMERALQSGIERDLRDHRPYALVVPCALIVAFAALTGVGIALHIPILAALFAVCAAVMVLAVVLALRASHTVSPRPRAVFVRRSGPVHVRSYAAGSQVYYKLQMLDYEEKISQTLYEVLQFLEDAEIDFTPEGAVIEVRDRYGESRYRVANYTPSPMS